MPLAGVFYIDKLCKICFSVAIMNAEQLQKITEVLISQFTSVHRMDSYNFKECLFAMNSFIKFLDQNNFLISVINQEKEKYLGDDIFEKNNLYKDYFLVKKLLLKREYNDLPYLSEYIYNLYNKLLNILNSWEFKDVSDRPKKLNLNFE